MSGFWKAGVIDMAIIKKKNIPRAPDSAEQNDSELAVARENAALPTEYMESGAVSASVKEQLSPREAYDRRRKADRRKIFSRIVSLVLAELLVLGAGIWEIRRHDLQKRSIRELQMQLTDQISLRTGTYTGETDFGWFDGTGSFDFRSGSEYSGAWDDNVFSGSGTLKSPTEGTYEGDFRNGKKDGTGTFTWADGTVYEGEWKNDEMSGKGTYRSADRLLLTGTFKENRFETGSCEFENTTGSYALTYSNGTVQSAEIEFSDGAKYSGTSSGTEMDGTGTLEFPNGDVYEGDFKSGARNGSGTYTWASGDIYTGAWADDKMEGTGTYTFANGNKLEGSFVDNALNTGKYSVSNDFGSYEFTIADGETTRAVIALNDGTRYEGEMKDDALTGAAQITYSNGDTYAGRVEQGQKSGSGVYTWANGAQYDGSWAADTMDGRGTYTYPSEQTGYKLVGSFSNGVPDGKCTYYATSLTSYETEWQDGKCVKVIE